MTDFGPLDLLGTIGRDRDYGELIGNTVQIEIEGAKVRILNLRTLILTKEEAGREKDKATLLVLRRTLEEQPSEKE
jgi:predicted nucleotidyltransferase